MTFTPERDPRIRALANQAAREIKALTDAHNTQIESIYRRFIAQSAAIKEQDRCSLTQPMSEGQDDETNADRLSSSGAGFSPKSTQ